ncbi:MAG: tRNA epoxyqueuosine(34) reductase QueG [Gammaproteobacteria bacterium]
MKGKDSQHLINKIRQWGSELGFQSIGVSNVDLSETEADLQKWLDAGFHGDMDWMAHHGKKRTRPAELEPGTVSIISARMDYYPDARQAEAVLQNPQQAYVSRYALGRDYHKLLRKRLQKLADHIQAEVGPFGYRVFVDSAPVMEKPIAEKAGLGWLGKHSNLIDKKTGSWFFLGEIYIDFALPVKQPEANHCGKCTSCITACPTQAIVEPYVVDARRCISYLTIELKGAIPEEFRKAIGNRIYGCDDCQLVCPWNRFAQTSQETDFQPRHRLDDITLVELFNWDENTFLHNFQGSAIRRIGYQRWLRNIAIALGNAPTSEKVINALKNKGKNASGKNSHEMISEMVREHIDWALQQHNN